MAFSLLLVLHASSALLGDVVSLSSPCSRPIAAKLCKAADESADGDHWVALVPTEPVIAAPSIDEALLTAPDSIQNVLGVPRVAVGGAPIAVGRLRRASTPPKIDCLTCSLAKEDEQHTPMIGLVVDALLCVWAETLARDEASKAAFETLTASSGLSTETALVSRGFRENEEVDLATLALGEGLATHTARLPSALFAANARAEQADLTEFDREHAQSLVDALRALDAPAQSEEMTQGGAGAKRDPWAAPIKGFGL